MLGSDYEWVSEGQTDYKRIFGPKNLLALYLPSKYNK